MGAAAGRRLLPGCAEAQVLRRAALSTRGSGTQQEEAATASQGGGWGKQHQLPKSHCDLRLSSSDLLCK